jgi:large subunit ribosomal protein L28
VLNPSGVNRVHLWFLLILNHLESLSMSRVCQISKKRRNKSNKICFSNKKHRKFQQVNLQSKRFWDPEQKRWIRLRVSTKVIKTISKVGLRATLKKYNQDAKVLNG